jgi:antitoxin VapB
MALSIKTAEADELARSLARLTGESMTEAITTALRERLARERARRETAATLPARLTSLSCQLRVAYDTRSVSREEWDAAAGDEG